MNSDIPSPDDSNPDPEQPAAEDFNQDPIYSGPVSEPPQNQPGHPYDPTGRADGYAPQPGPPQPGQTHAGYPPHGYAPHGYPQQGHPQQGYPQQGYGYPPNYGPPPKPPLPEISGPRSPLPVVSIAWIVVAAIVALLLGSNVYIQMFEPPATGDMSAAELMQINLQGKMLVAQAALGGKEKTEIPAQLNAGPPENRYCYAILLNEFDQPSLAVDQLKEVDRLVEVCDYELSDRQQRIRELLRELFEEYESDSADSRILADEDREFLSEELGYLGDLVLYPENTPESESRAALVKDAQFSLYSLGGIFLLGLLMGIGGLILLIVFFIQLGTNKLHPAFRLSTTDGGIYIETFAIWMIAFIVMQLGIGLLSVGEIAELFLVPIAFFGSLIVLVWPVIRGVSVSQLFKDIGWRIRNPLVETFFGTIAYLATMPLVAFSLIFAVIIMFVMASFQTGGNELSSLGGVGHPIQEQIAAGNALVIFAVFLTACVAAPVVEETMFRGVLYRHLREASRTWQLFMTVMFSAILNGLVFAMIHPQGLMGIPMLTTLAVAFSLAREWRDSLIAPMVMHGINNAMITALLVLIV